MIGSRHMPRGFTLIEAMAAIVVMSIVIPVLLEGFNLASDMAKVTLQTADATLLAQSTLDELVSTGNWQNASIDTQQVGKYVYNIEVTTDMWDNEIDISQVIVRVHWTDRGAREVVLTTLVYYADVTSPENSTVIP